MSPVSSFTSLSSFLVSSSCDDIAERRADDRLLGNVRFLGFYLVGGIASTMASLFWRRLRGDHTTSSEGASGAIYSCMGTLSLFSLGVARSRWSSDPSNELAALACYS
jgi:membrane associated rhomboid family serine protease